MINSHFFPFFYFQTTVLLVDDNKEFLSNLALILNEHYIYKLMTNPTQTILFLNERKNLFDRLGSSSANILYNSRITEHETGQEQIYFDITKIYQIIYDRERFSEPSIIIVDYDMPEMNGIELCRQLKNHPVKKIMLTGAADYITAVQAFNEGLIDKFIIKSSELMSDEINTAIHELQWRFFQELTAKILNFLPLSAITCLSDPVISEFLKKHFYETNSAEIYMIDYTGSFMLLDFNGNPSWIVIATDEAMNDYYEVAVDHEAPNNIIDDIKTRKKIPLFADPMDHKLPVSEWSKLLYPANFIPGKNNVYYAIAKEKAYA